MLLKTSLKHTLMAFKIQYGEIYINAQQALALLQFNLKSNMERFIFNAEMENEQFFRYLKSNMERFIFATGQVHSLLFFI